MAEAFIALLRGINVGRGNRVPMAQLRTLLEGLGYRHIVTLLNSGNAVFCTSAKDGARADVAIRQGLLDELGVAVAVIVKSAEQFRRIVSGFPGASAPDPSRLLVVFSAGQDEFGSLTALQPLLMREETLSITPNAAYLHCAAGLLESKAGAALLGKLGRGFTTRNWATVQKIAAALARMPSGESSDAKTRRGVD